MDDEDSNRKAGPSTSPDPPRRVVDPFMLAVARGRPRKPVSKAGRRIWQGLGLAIVLSTFVGCREWYLGYHRETFVADGNQIAHVIRPKLKSMAPPSAHADERGAIGSNAAHICTETEVFNPRRHTCSGVSVFILSEDRPVLATILKTLRQDICAPDAPLNDVLYGECVRGAYVGRIHISIGERDPSNNARELLWQDFWLEE